MQKAETRKQQIDNTFRCLLPTAFRFSSRERSERGFTLVEIVVSVGLFAIVVLISLSTLLALTHANRKAQALQSVMNNLNIALDGMVRTIRSGTNYHCGTGSYTGNPASDDCLGGNTRISLEAFGGTAATGDDIVYQYDAGSASIQKSRNGGLSYVTITAPEVRITEMRFYVAGTERGDILQPRVLISLQGTAETAFSGPTIFNIQAVALQRVLDI